jgi:hypothetical protein
MRLSVDNLLIPASHPQRWRPMETTGPGSGYAVDGMD